MRSLSEFAQWSRTVIGIGRNYAEHARELQNPVPSGAPLLFLKPGSTLHTPQQGAILLPRGHDVHHEVELAVILGRDLTRPACRDIKDEHTLLKHFVGGYACALDLTDRTEQTIAKSKGLPWMLAKGRRTFTPIGPFIDASTIKDPHALKLRCDVNGVTKQHGPTSDMLFKIPSLLQYLSTILDLQRGDVILSGTPAGVGPIRPGDKVRFGIDGHDPIQFEVREENES